MSSEEPTTPPDASTDHAAERTESPEAAVDPSSEPSPPAEPVAYTRVCRRCAAQATTTADACPACGKRYARRRLPRRVVVAAALIVALLSAGGGAAAYLDHRADVKRERERIARVKAAERKAEQERREREEQERAIDRIVVSAHRDSALQLRKAVTKDAQEKYDDGLLEDRATGSQCENTDGNEDDPDADLAEYECLAITDHNGDGTVGGYTYTGRVNYDDGTITWKLGD